MVKVGDCTVDLDSACLEYFSKQTLRLNGAEVDSKRLAENSGRRNERFYFWIAADDGHTVLARFSCFMRTQPVSVVSSELLKDPPLGPEAIDYLKNHGLCEPSPENYQKEIDRQKAIYEKQL